MARAMLEYTKTVLQKVSFDPVLFYKELQKAISFLLPYEIKELELWLSQYVVGKPELKHYVVYIKVK